MNSSSTTPAQPGRFFIHRSRPAPDAPPRQRPSPLLDEASRAPVAAPPWPGPKLAELGQPKGSGTQGGRLPEPQGSGKVVARPVDA
jgi:hypothetical protein